MAVLLPPVGGGGRIVWFPSRIGRPSTRRMAVDGKRRVFLVCCCFVAIPSPWCSEPRGRSLRRQALGKLARPVGEGRTGKHSSTVTHGDRPAAASGGHSSDRGDGSDRRRVRG